MQFSSMLCVEEANTICASKSLSLPIPTFVLSILQTLSVQHFLFLLHLCPAILGFCSLQFLSGNLFIFAHQKPKAILGFCSLQSRPGSLFTFAHQNLEQFFHLALYSLLSRNSCILLTKSKVILSFCSLQSLSRNSCILLTKSTTRPSALDFNHTPFTS